jgi:hypothetical protein
VVNNAGGFLLRLFEETTEEDLLEKTTPHAPCYTATTANWRGYAPPSSPRVTVCFPSSRPRWAAPRAPTRRAATVSSN